MENRRKEERTLVQTDGFFVHDSVLWEVKLRDLSSEGVGAYCNRRLSSNDLGVLFTKLPSESEQRDLPAQVLWCIKDPHPHDPHYAYRLGLRLLQ